MKTHRYSLLDIPIGYSICMSLKIIKLCYFNQRIGTDDVKKVQGAKPCFMSRDWDLAQYS